MAGGRIILLCLNSKMSQVLNGRRTSRNSVIFWTLYSLLPFSFLLYMQPKFHNLYKQQKLKESLEEATHLNPFPNNNFKFFQTETVPSIFSFSHNVFYPSQNKFQFFSHIYFVVYKCSQSGLV